MKKILLGAMLLVSVSSMSEEMNKNMDKMMKMETKSMHMMQEEKSMKVVSSKHDFNTTVNKLKEVLASRNLTVFSIIDHKQNAVEVGLNMNPLTVVVFGNAKVGTNLMLENPLVGLDLPLRIAIKEENGKVELFYHDIKKQTEQYGLEKTKQIVENMSKLLDMLANAAAN